MGHTFVVAPSRALKTKRKVAGVYDGHPECKVAGVYDVKASSRGPRSAATMLSLILPFLSNTVQNLLVNWQNTHSQTD